MATLLRTLTVGLLTNKHADLETVTLAEGDAVDVVRVWPTLVLVKDGDGHFYNLPKDALAGLESP